MEDPAPGIAVDSQQEVSAPDQALQGCSAQTQALAETIHSGNGHVNEASEGGAAGEEWVAVEAHLSQEGIFAEGASDSAQAAEGKSEEKLLDAGVDINDGVITDRKEAVRIARQFRESRQPRIPTKDHVPGASQVLCCVCDPAFPSGFYIDHRPCNALLCRILVNLKGFKAADSMTFY